MISVIFCSAQFYKSFQSSPAFSDSLNKVVLDFRYNFKEIQGNALLPRGDMDVYNSKVTLPGAEHCVVYRFHSRMDTTASWQAVMYEGDSYEEAKKIYKNTFRQVKSSRIKWIDNSRVNFTGQMEEPSENIGFTVSSLKPDIKDERYEKFWAEVEMINTYAGWEVHLNLQNKKKDTEE